MIMPTDARSTPAHAFGMPYAPSTIMERRTRTSDVEAGKTHRLRVLVVDDYPDTAETMAMLLRLRGYTVDIARSGAAAIRLAQKHRPRVALLDISMPGMSGYELAKNLRRMFPGAPLRLIAITAHSFEEDRRRCREAGFDCHLTKPADPGDVERLL